MAVPCNVCGQSDGYLQIFANLFQSIVHIGDNLMHPVELLLLRLMVCLQNGEQIRVAIVMVFFNQFYGFVLQG